MSTEEHSDGTTYYDVTFTTDDGDKQFSCNEFEAHGHLDAVAKATERFLRTLPTDHPTRWHVMSVTTS